VDSSTGLVELVDEAEAEAVVRTTLGVLVMVVWGRTEERRVDVVRRVLAPWAPVLEAPKPGTFPDAVGRTVELDGTPVAVTGQMVVETATTTVVTSPTVQSPDAAVPVGQAVMVDVWEVKMVLVVIGTEELNSSEVLAMEGPEAEGVTATAAVSDVAVAGTGTGLVSVGRRAAELAEASDAVTGQMVVSTTTTTVVSPASLTLVDVPVT
jgi:hypothetical protein